MLKTEDIRKKVFHQAEMFGHYFSRKEYARAKAAYDTARTVAVFCEMEEADMKELFGDRPYISEDKEASAGMFKEEDVQKAYLECIKKNQTFENKIYPGRPSKNQEAER